MPVTYRLVVTSLVLCLATAAAAQEATAPAPPAAPPISPLTIRVGDADLLIGGFMDATAIMRSTNVGSGIGTAFASIPFGNTPQGQLSETRLTAQNSRVSLQATTKVGTAAVKGYVEADFLGSAPANAFVTSNANTVRMRLYWVQLLKGRFEFLGGQSWSFLTPNRTGLSPVPGDIFFTQNMDTNYQVGLTWARQTQFRFVAHPSRALAAGVSIENPQQYVGPAVILPAAFAAGQVDNGSNTATPNRYPDIVGKVAFDPQTGATHQHFEIAGLVRGFRTYDIATARTFSATGGGASANVNLEPVKGVHLVGTTFLSSGGGRYIFGLGPDLVADADGRPTRVGARAGTAGVEVQARPKTLVFGYYGRATFDREVTVDTGGRAIGYGVAGSTTANRAIAEVTVGANQTFFREPRYGALQLIAQYSRATRAPWGTPAKARAHMVWVNVRYVLP